MSNNAPVPYDPAIAEALGGLAKYVDQRPSTSGFAPAILEIDRVGGGLVDVNTGEAFPSINIVPVMLREVRSYWARKGTGDKPDCRSTDGVRPVKDGDVEPQSPECATCPWNKFKTAETGKGKKCKTKAVLFGLRMGGDGRLLDGVVIRFSASNRSANQAIQTADKKAAEAGVPRPLSIWKVGSCIERAKKQGDMDYVFLKPEFAGVVPKDQAQRVVETIKELGPEGGADRFLAGSSDSAAE